MLYKTWDDGLFSTGLVLILTLEYVECLFLQPVLDYTSPCWKADRGLQPFELYFVPVALSNKLV